LHTFVIILNSATNDHKVLDLQHKIMTYLAYKSYTHFYLNYIKKIMKNKSKGGYDLLRVIFS